MADDDVISNLLGRVRETGLIGFAVVLRAGPAVGLNVDCNIDLRYFERAADVTDRVIVRLRMRAADDCILRRDRFNARIQTAVAGIRIRIGVAEPCQRIAVKQTFDPHLIRQRFRQIQNRTVVLLGLVYNGDRELLLIEQGEDQGTVFRKSFRNLIGRTCHSTGICFAYDRLVEFPLSDRRARQRKGLADLQVLYRRIRDRSAVHVNIVDGDLNVLVAGVVERDDVLLRFRCQNQRLFRFIREELDTVQFGMRRIQRVIVDRRSQFDDGGHIAVNRNRLLLRNRDVARILFRIEDVLDNIGRLVGLRNVHEGKLVVRRLECQRVAVLLRTVAGNRDRLFGDDLIDHEVRVRDGLVRRNRIAFLIHIVHGVA